ncbi:MAG: hypothetical protein JXR31_05415, partial [Prolixibacteraceae bacterium]|nr:hypothetical protein [Prolixibacteraceae bacterium]
MNKKEQIPDKIFREKLEGLTVPPPPDTFQKIQARLKIKKRKVAIIWYRSIAAAAIIVFALTAGWFFNNENKVIPPEINTISEIQETKPQKPENRVEERNEIVISETINNERLIAEA